jgi:glycosyltransferase involved in cell wall biosynthesis
MRIAIFHNLTSGGAKRSLQEEVRRLTARHTLEVYALSCANHEFADIRPYVADYRIYPFRPLPLFRSPFGRLNQIMRWFDLKRLDRLARQVAMQIEKAGYDLVFVQPCQFENTPSVVRYLRRHRSVFYCHEPLRVLYEATPFRPYIEPLSWRRRVLNRLDPLPGVYRRALRNNDQANIRRADRVLVNSHFTRGNVKTIYQVEAEVSYHGVDAAHFRPLGLEKQRMALSVGSLTPLKGFDFLIEALAALPERERPPLAIASNFQNPPERDYLLGLAQGKGVVLHLLGNVSEEKLLELYNQAMVTVYAPYHEPFGFVSLESMACATPVVAVREGGIQEAVIHEKTGLLTRRDPAEFAQAVSRLLANPELSQELGAEGRRHVLQNWTWERAITTLEGQLAAVL